MQKRSRHSPARRGTELLKINREISSFLPALRFGFLRGFLPKRLFKRLNGSERTDMGAIIPLHESLCLYGKTSPRHGLQPLPGNRPACQLAYPIRSVVDPSQSRVNLVESLLFK